MRDNSNQAEVKMKQRYADHCALPTAGPAAVGLRDRRPPPTPAPTQPPTAARPRCRLPQRPRPTKASAAGLPAYTGGPVTLRFAYWGNDDRVARTNKVIELFQAAYPQIKVKGEPSGGTADHFQIIDTQLAGNNAPDLIQFGGNYPDYIKYLQPLNDYLGKQLLIDTPERFDQTALIPATR